MERSEKKIVIVFRVVFRTQWSIYDEIFKKKIDNGLNSLSNFVKSSIVHVLLGSQYSSGIRTVNVLYTQKKE